MNRQHFAVSVIVPTYNRADLVCIAIDSLLAQTRVPNEIIIVDDGSTDHTSQMLARYQSPVRVIRQPNAGRSAARNRGLDEAHGDLIAFLDSDDILFPESIARRAEVLEQHPEIGAVYSDILLVTPEQQEIGVYSHIYPTPRPSGMIFAELARRDILPILTVLFRRPAKTLRFDEALDLFEDYDFWLRLSAQYPFHYLNEPLAAVRMPEGAEFSAAEWGLPCGSAKANAHRAKYDEIAVQARAINSDAFRQLTRLQRAKILCSHGMKNHMIGQNQHARQLFRASIRTAPYYMTGYSLLLLSVLGGGIFNEAILMRRRMIRLVDRAR